MYHVSPVSPIAQFLERGVCLTLVSSTKHAFLPTHSTTLSPPRRIRSVPHVRVLTHQAVLTPSLMLRVTARGIASPRAVLTPPIRPAPTGSPETDPVPPVTSRSPSRSGTKSMSRSAGRFFGGSVFFFFFFRFRTHHLLGSLCFVMRLFFVVILRRCQYCFFFQCFQVQEEQGL